MSKTIWKYPITPDDCTIEMPWDARILCVQVQRDTVCLWAEVDPEHAKAKRRFVIYGTGHELTDEPGRYIGTFQLHGGALVFHVYEDSTK